VARFHEDMQGEGFAWLRAALGHPPPAGLPAPMRVGPAAAPHLPAGEAQIGWPPARRGFAFDNEREAHAVALPAVEIDDAPLSVGRFLAFVEAGGYDEPAFWPGEAGAWREAQDRRAPERWRRD